MDQLWTCLSLEEQFTDLKRVKMSKTGISGYLKDADDEI